MNGYLECEMKPEFLSRDLLYLILYACVPSLLGGTLKDEGLMYYDVLAYLVNWCKMCVFQRIWLILRLFYGPLAMIKWCIIPIQYIKRIDSRWWTQHYYLYTWRNKLIFQTICHQRNLCLSNDWTSWQYLKETQRLGVAFLNLYIALKFDE